MVWNTRTWYERIIKKDIYCILLSAASPSFILYWKLQERAVGFILSGRTFRTKYKRMEISHKRCGKYSSNFGKREKKTLQHMKTCHIMRLQRPWSYTGTTFFAPWFQVNGTTSLFNKHLERAVSTDVVTFVQRFLGSHKRPVCPWHSAWAAEPSESDGQRLSAEL